MFLQANLLKQDLIKLACGIEKFPKNGKPTEWMQARKILEEELTVDWDWVRGSNVLDIDNESDEN
jgi:hypothetical protein